MTQAARSVRHALIVEDIAETRDWLSALVRETFAGVTVHTAYDLRSARRWLAGRDTEAMGVLALVDLGLPDGSGVDLIREMRQAHPSVQVVVTTVYDDDSHLLQAMAAGAHGYLLKDRDIDELREQLLRLQGGEAALSPAVARRVLEQFRVHASFVLAPGVEATSLTPRETEVLRLIGRGLTLNEAAGVLGISPQTVGSYVKVIYRKLGIANRAEAALEAARRSLT